MGKYDLVFGLAGLAVGGFVFMKYMWPSIRQGFGDIGDELAALSRPEPEVSEERYLPSMLIEDRFPDYIVEDRYPDYIVDPYPYPDFNFQYPFFPPNCSAGRFWDGNSCRKIDCGRGLKWDDGICRPDCPNGYRWDDNRCKPRYRDCDDDEFWNGNRCEKRPRRDGGPSRGGRPDNRDCPPGMHWSDGRCKPREVKCRNGYYNDNGTCKKRGPDSERRWGGNPRDRWHEDRDREEVVKKVLNDTKSRILDDDEANGPPEQRVKEIAEKALQSFIEVEYA